MNANCDRKKCDKMEKPKKNKLNKNDFISTKKMKKIIKKTKKK